MPEHQPSGQRSYHQAVTPSGSQDEVLGRHRHHHPLSPLPTRRTTRRPSRALAPLEKTGTAPAFTPMVKSATSTPT
ncbi:MAG: hypothetical protein IPN76_06735 [Saprospiraceae bacterium]|nr:hypothetical protein [Saprospiraceae bacterium]